MSKPRIISGEWKEVDNGGGNVYVENEFGKRVAKMTIRRMMDDNAQAIVTAVNSTYKKGLDPEAYEEVVEALESCYELCDKYWYEQVVVPQDFRENIELIKNALKKARINE